SASDPLALLSLPVVLLKSALKPVAVLSKPAVLFKSASSPRTVFSFVKQPSWQTARAFGESAKQASTSAMSSKAGGQQEQFIEFFDGRVVVFIMCRVLKKSGQLGKTNWDAVIRVYDEARIVIETHEHAGDFKRMVSLLI